MADATQFVKGFAFDLLSRMEFKSSAEPGAGVDSGDEGGFPK
jgi:hypothetical protein